MDRSNLEPTASPSSLRCLADNHNGSDRYPPSIASQQSHRSPSLPTLLPYAARYSAEKRWLRVIWGEGTHVTGAGYAEHRLGPLHLLMLLLCVPKQATPPWSVKSLIGIRVGRVGTADTTSGTIAVAYALSLCTDAGSTHVSLPSRAWRGSLSQTTRTLGAIDAPPRTFAVAYVLFLCTEAGSMQEFGISPRGYGGRSEMWPQRLRSDQLVYCRCVSKPVMRRASKPQ